VVIETVWIGNELDTDHLPAMTNV